MAKGRKTGGRKAGSVNKDVSDIRALARTYVPASVVELARLALEAECEKARVSAIKEILDRAYGKAPQAIQHSGDLRTGPLVYLPPGEEPAPIEANGHRNGNGHKR